MKNEPKFQFGEIVMVQNGFVGVIVKTWEKELEYHYEVYVRSFNAIKDYDEEEISHYIHHKELSEDDLQYYK